MDPAVHEPQSAALFASGRGALPLLRYERLRTRDADEIHDFVASIFCSHRLLPRTRDGQVDARVHHAPLGSTSLNYLRYGVPVVVDPGELKDFFLVQVQLAGALDLQYGRQRASLGAGFASVLSPTRPVRMSWTGDAAEYIVWMRRGAVERCLAGLLGRPLREPLVFDPAMDCRRGLAASWLRAAEFVRAEVEIADSLAASPLAVQQIEQMLIHTLLCCQPHNYFDALQQGPPPAVPRHVRVAEEYLRAHVAESVSLEQLAAVAGVSVRALFAGFQRYRGTSPMKYLRSIRLQRARQDLLAATRDTTVTEVALRFGFTQLGRFAVDYRQAFGESPSVTLKRGQ